MGYEYPDYDDHKQVVVINVAAYVHLVFPEFPCVEKVKDLQEHENVEKYAQMHTCLFIPMRFIKAYWAFDPKNFRPSKQNDHKNNYLEDSTH